VTKSSPSPADAEELRSRLESKAEAAGYHLNPDREFARGLAEGLIVNERRYGYRSCPCRLASGDTDVDRDIVCPCDYRDADLLDWGSCYCGLYVSAKILAGEQNIAQVPERRLPPGDRRAITHGSLTRRENGLSVWRCRVCGYLCAREHPPAVCPICGAASDRFESFA
jgi:ferredoxin-thioredoxin reductase catalytic subunit